MSIETIWIIILSISTPIAGVVGFAIQVRNVKKARLENEKLILEIQKLKGELKKSNERVILPTNDEVSQIMHSKELYEFKSNAYTDLTHELFGISRLLNDTFLGWLTARHLLISILLLDLVIIVLLLIQVIK